MHFLEKINVCHLGSSYRPQTKFAKVMFLHLSVSHSVHRGVSASVHAGTHPPWVQTPPGADTPQEADTPKEADTPPRKRTPPGSRHPPSCTVHAGRYGKQAGSTHPTGMHTCFTKCAYFMCVIININI